MDTVSYNKNDIIRILKNLNTLVVSLDRIGSEESEVSKEEYHRMSSDFLDNWRVGQMLSDARRVLGEAFSYEVGDDGMDELERMLEDFEFWRISKQLPNKPFTHPVFE